MTSRAAYENSQRLENLVLIADQMFRDRIVLGTSDQREYKIETDASVKPIQHQTKKVNQSTKEDIHTQLKDIENKDPVCLGK